MGGNSPTFSVVSDKHLLHEKKKTKAKDEEYIETLKPYIGKTPFNNIKRPIGDPSCLDLYIKDCVKKKLSITTVNKHIKFINTLGNKAVKNYNMLEHWYPITVLSSAEGKELGLKPPVRKKALTREMENVLLRHLPNSEKDMVIFSINTGLRNTLLCNLKWDWVKQDSPNVWYLEIPMECMKNAEYIEDDWVFVLNSTARDIIKGRQGNKSPYIFPCLGDFSKSVETLYTTSYKVARARGALTCPDLMKTDVHSFRRTFATRLREKMIPKEFIQQMMGQKSNDVLEEYIKVSPEIRRRLFDYGNEIINEELGQVKLRRVK